MMNKINNGMLELVKRYPDKAPAFFGLSSALIISFAIVLIKYHENIDANQFIYKRGIIITAINTLVIRSQKINTYIFDPTVLKLVIMRGVWIVICIFFWMNALHMISAGLTTVLENTNAIWTLLFMSLLYGDPILRIDL
jgi:drug/metabolite transporter (DMT)-like permease